MARNNYVEIVENVTGHIKDNLCLQDFKKTMSTDEEPSSGDFMVLDSTSSPQELPEQRGVSTEELMAKREEAILKVCSICGYDNDGSNLRPLRIVVIGKHGAGKSSFINGLAAALSEDRWHEYAYTGDLGKGEPITIVNQRLVKCSNSHRDCYKNVLLPTIIDVPGLIDEFDEKLEELLRLLFYGHIEEDEPMAKIYEDIKYKTKDEIRAKYYQTFPEMRVDRVVFIAAANDKLPERLLACVHGAAQPSHHKEERRAVPIYGVLTKMDKVNLKSTTYLEKKKAFMQSLGLNQSRFMVCSNYCDDLDPHGERTLGLNPELDLPLLRFLQLVCNRALKVVKEGEVLPGSEGKSKEALENVANTQKQAGQRGAGAGDGLDPMHRDAMTAGVIGLVTLMALFMFVPLTGQGWDKFRQQVGQMVIAAIVTVIVFLYQYINRRI